MRKLLKAFWFFVVTAILYVSCRTEETRDARMLREHHPFATVRVWIAPHPVLHRTDVVTGCRYWCTHGVSCRSVNDPDDADVRVDVDSDPCVQSNDGTFYLAGAHLDRHISVRVACFETLRDSPVYSTDRKNFRSVLAHEFGHQFGIWDHIPLNCNDPHKVHSSGAPICGDALMNPLWRATTPYPTKFDDLAFDERDRSISVLKIGASVPDEDAPPCISVCPRE